ncbi:MAG: putative Ig domain-containing protein, partial [Candidatus Riflebacteria bacterium]|nr:putative Ig domain-containing protein [Candidatus Riflebacteria bacterium]
IVKQLRSQLNRASDPNRVDGGLYAASTDAVKKLFDLSRARLTAANTDVLETLEQFKRQRDPLPPLVVKPRQLPRATTGLPYATRLFVLGGQSPFSFAVTRGYLPAGLTLDGTTGRFSGTPQVEGVFSFDLTVRDASGATDTRPVQLFVDRLTFRSPAVYPDAVRSRAYPAVRTEVVGGTPPHTFHLTEGSLPAGLALANTGEISGTSVTAQPGPVGFTIGVRDATGATSYMLCSVLVRSSASPSVAPQRSNPAADEPPGSAAERATRTSRPDAAPEFHTSAPGGEVLDLGFQAFTLFPTDILFSGDETEVVVACSGAQWLAVGTVAGGPPEFRKKVTLSTPWVRMIAASGAGRRSS